MTDAQRQWLSDLAYKHRRQIPESVRRQYPRIFAPEPPPFEEIMHLMTDDEILDAIGSGQEWEPDAENPQDEALYDEIEHKADATAQSQTYSCQERLL
jgi:cation transport regulator ChaB